jgi:HlyD family secretion protein
MIISAPIAGTVYTLDAAPAQFAEAGKLLLQMADLHHERVRAYVDEPDLGRLAIGQKVKIHWDAKPARDWHGHISRLPATVVTYTTRNVGEVLVDFDDDSDGLLPDTNVTVTVIISSEDNVLAVPVEAIHEQSGRYFVYKVVGDELKRTPVTIGTRNMTQAPVVSGLSEGDWVATGTLNGQSLQEDIPIREQR